MSRSAQFRAPVRRAWAHVCCPLSRCPPCHQQTRSAHRPSPPRCFHVPTPKLPARQRVAAAGRRPAACSGGHPREHLTVGCSQPRHRARREPCRRQGASPAAVATPLRPCKAACAQPVAGDARHPCTLCRAPPLPPPQVDAGAEVLLTQPPLDWPAFERWWGDVTRRGLHRTARLVIGFPALSSAANAAFWVALAGAGGSAAARGVVRRFAAAEAEGKGAAAAAAREYSEQQLRQARTGRWEGRGQRGSGAGVERSTRCRAAPVARQLAPQPTQPPSEPPVKPVCDATLPPPRSCASCLASAGCTSCRSPPRRAS